jgi:hypothetical protein
MALRAVLKDKETRSCIILLYRSFHLNASTHYNEIKTFHSLHFALMVE